MAVFQFFCTFVASWSRTRNEKQMNYQDVRGGPSRMFPPAITRNCCLFKVSFGTFRDGSSLFDMIQKNDMFHISKQLFFVFAASKKGKLFIIMDARCSDISMKQKETGSPQKTPRMSVFRAGNRPMPVWVVCTPNIPYPAGQVIVQTCQGGGRMWNIADRLGFFNQCCRDTQAFTPGHHHTPAMDKDAAKV